MRHGLVSTTGINGFLLLLAAAIGPCYAQLATYNFYSDTDAVHMLGSFAFSPPLDYPLCYCAKIPNTTEIVRSVVLEAAAGLKEGIKAYADDECKELVVTNQTTPYPLARSESGFKSVSWCEDWLCYLPGAGSCAY